MPLPNMYKFREIHKFDNISVPHEEMIYLYDDSSRLRQTRGTEGL